MQKDLIAKDLEVQQRKMRKSPIHTSDYKADQVFKWQSKLEEPLVTSAYSTPEREVRIEEPLASTSQQPPLSGGWEREDYYTPRRNQDHPGHQNNWYQTPRNSRKKSFKKSLRNLIPMRAIIQELNMTDCTTLVTLMKDFNKTNPIMKDTREILENIPTHTHKQDEREVRYPPTIDLNL